MPSELTCLRVFIASPRGLAEERKAFRDEIQEFNDADAIPRSVLSSRSAGRTHSAA